MANEKRLDLIDRGALGIGIANPLVFDKTEYAHGWNCAIEIIQNAPTVDAVEVVRCKDCRKRYNPKECPMCVRVYGEQHDFTQENGYCDRGERRSDA